MLRQPQHEAKDGRLVGPLLDRLHESIDDIRLRSRAWAQQAGCKLKQQSRRFKGETHMLYAVVSTLVAEHDTR